MKYSSTDTRKQLRLLALALALPLALPFTASAQDDDSGWYLGLGAGRSYADFDNGAINAALQTGGYSASQLQTDDKDSTFKFLGGYNFNRHMALEASYFDLGDFDFAATLLPAASQQGKAYQLRGFALDLVGTLPLRDKLSAFARLGLNNAQVKQSFSGTAVGTGFVQRSDRGWNEKYGVGLQYAVNDAFTLRTEVERYHLDDSQLLKDKLDTFTVGAVYRFGTRKPAAPVAQPAPAPTPAPAPAPRAPIELTLSADTAFDFDRAELKAEGRQELDKLVQDMRDLDYDIVIVTGHTDRIGAHDYNMRLSQQRADAVKNHLVAAGVPTAKITATGVNSDQPVTRPDQCINTGSAQAQIACLQPDRRVVVRVSGTRDPE